MKTILAILVVVLVSACGKADLQYPCNFYYAPAEDNGSICQQCFASPEAELSFMEKFLPFQVGFYQEPGRSEKLNAITDAIMGPTPGQDLYPILIDVLGLTPGYPQGWCGGKGDH